ncbi:MAG: hypothetical protein J0L84_12325 [Verrucomicrobia bacterium]|nr:hypothetical protein [Verrucomicrobiota bacterium]
MVPSNIGKAIAGLWVVEYFPESREASVVSLEEHLNRELTLPVDDGHQNLPCMLAGIFRSESEARERVAAIARDESEMDSRTSFQSLKPRPPGATPFTS